jgi:hypothetical protein
MTTRILRVDKIAVRVAAKKKICFFSVTGYLKKIDITSDLIETQSSIYAHFRAKKLPILMICYASVFSGVYFQGIHI